MKRIGLIGIVFTLLTSFQLENKNYEYRYLPNENFETGRELEYTVRFGWVNAGTAKISTDKDIHEVNGRPCYKVDVYGNSKGILDFIIKIRNQWGTYIDTSAFISHGFYRYILEDNYKKNERVHFDHQRKLAIVERLDEDTRALVDTAKFEIPDNIQDMVSSYYYLTTLDFDKIEQGDTISVDAFFDDEVYKFKVRFLGREALKTKLGTFNTLVLAPVLPKNSVFDGGNAIEIWLSDDKSKIPLKIKADLLLGAIEIDIKNLEKG